jgi:hypothetical protein
MSDFAKLKSMIGPAAPVAPEVKPEAPVDFEKEVSKPKKGGLPIGLIASIQKEYQREQKEIDKDMNAKPAKMGLDTGWGGKGR